MVPARPSYPRSTETRGTAGVTTILLGLYLKYDENGKLKLEMVLAWYAVDHHDMLSVSDQLYGDAICKNLATDARLYCIACR